MSSFILMKVLNADVCGIIEDKLFDFYSWSYHTELIIKKIKSINICDRDLKNYFTTTTALLKVIKEYFINLNLTDRDIEIFIHTLFKIENDIETKSIMYDYKFYQHRKKIEDLTKIEKIELYFITPIVRSNYKNIVIKD